MLPRDAHKMVHVHGVLVTTWCWWWSWRTRPHVSASGFPMGNGHGGVDRRHARRTLPWKLMKWWSLLRPMARARAGHMCAHCSLTSRSSSQLYLYIYDLSVCRRSFASACGLLSLPAWLPRHLHRPLPNTEHGTTST